MIVYSLVSACEGDIGDPTTAALHTDTPPSLAPTSGSPAANGGSGKSGNSENNPTNNAGGPAPSNGATPSACTPESAAAAPLARLTNLEYRNSVADLFQGVTLPELSLPPDNVVEGFDNNAKAQTPSPALIEALRGNAQAVAAAVVNKLDSVLPCKPANASQEAACAGQWIDALAPRVYRRPISTEEKTRLQGLFSGASAAYGFSTAVSLVVQALLQSPQFIYRPEIGEPASGGARLLTPYELASRLSYFFWDTTPDAALIAAASSGELDDARGVEAQARRLLADPRSRPAVANFHRQWLRFDKMDTMQKSASLFPTWSPQVADSLRSSATKFVDHVFWEMDGSLDALLTDTQAYVNDDIAAIYGLPKNGSTALALRETDPAERSGILTQAGLMAGFAHETTDSPVLRGVFVLDRFLCSPPPPPPPGVTGSVTEVTTSTAALTTRDRFAMTHESGTCATCHHAIDGFGFGFSHYDAVGAWRETDNGLKVNAKGWISGTTDANGDFDGAVDLGQRLADSTQVSECVTEQWFRYALGLSGDDVDSCTVAQIGQTLQKKNGDMREILIATVSSAAFRHRPEVTP